jgi:toxin YoeB
MFQLISSIKSTPFKGLGEPEPLKHALKGWSQRINPDDRLFYRIAGKGAARQLEIAQCRLHY